jgi:hypothetical protein
LAMQVSKDLAKKQADICLPYIVVGEHAVQPQAVTARADGNHFYPSMKLVEKHRVGSRVYKCYNSPKSPYRLLLDCPSLEEPIKQRLREEHRHLRPLQLKKRIAELQDQLYRLARRKYSPASGPLPAAELTCRQEAPSG